MAARPWNYGSGPAMLPEPVLREAQGALLDLNGSNLSVLEISHRSPTFQRVIDEADANLRSLLSIPESHAVIFTQGGATLQFAAVPMNLVSLPGTNNRPTYLVTGAWSQKALSEAKRYGEPVSICDAASNGYRGVPAAASWEPIDPLTPYIYYCDNETVHGVAFGGSRPPAELVVRTTDPAAKLDHVPIVVDMSSSLLTRQLELSAYDVIIAGAQKNCGISGLTIVIARKELLGHALRTTPVLMDYKTLADSGSMHNTPATFSIYLAGLVFQWVLRNGGLEAMESASLRRAAALYQAIDESRHFRANVELGSRSDVNITFRVFEDKSDGSAPSAALEKAFVAAAIAHSPPMLELAGHRSVGGLRASLYNAMPFEGVEALVTRIREFDAQPR